MSEQLGALPAPPGWEVNINNPTQEGAITGYWVCGVGLGLATILLVIRIYTKTMISRNFGWEDTCLLLGYGWGIGVQAIMLHTWVIKASGVHGWEVPLPVYYDFLWLVAWVSIIYVPCLGFAKISILLLYRRLSQLRWFIISVWIVAAIVVAYSIALALALIFPCNPIRKNWDPTMQEGTCIDKAAIYLANAAINAITDLMILVLPIPMVMKLQMPTIQKVGLMAIFAFGSATCVTSLVRLYYMVPLLKNPDQTHAISVPFIWVGVEANLIIICFCLPSLRTLIRHYAPTWLGESNPTANSRGSTRKAGSRLNASAQYGMMSEGADIEMNSSSKAYASRGRYGSESGEANRSDDDHDGSSEKAIWQTRTVTVARE